MARNFPDFISSYLSYARDNYCPDEFHKWIGISICAAALERKVSLNQGIIRHYPNIYTMLVSHPGVGKSTAINRGVDLLNALVKDHQSAFRIIPNQSTEPALIEAMKIIDYFPAGPEGRQIFVPQSAGFFYADEASSSALQNVFGDFIATLTAFYDCPEFFRKGTVMRGQNVLENVCMNLLAGSTFNYLKELVNERSVLGGFASRLIYVVAKERRVREVKWHFKDEKDYAVRNALVTDLAEIHKLSGPMRPTDGFIKRFETWQPNFDRELIALNSEKLESIMARKGTNLIKLSMIVSVSESSDMVVTEEHFDRAVDLIEEVTADNSLIISRAIMEQKDTQGGINEAIKSFIQEGITSNDLRLKILEHGSDVKIFEQTFTLMLNSGLISVGKNGKLCFGGKAKG